MVAMKKMDTNENNSLSKNIIELKIITDRLAEGETSGTSIFTNMHQVLFILNRKDTVSPREIISELNIAKSNLAILAKKMIEDGLIESHKDKNNKREIYYNITPLGCDVLQKRLDTIDEIFDGGSKSLINLLTKAPNSPSLSAPASPEGSSSTGGFISPKS